MSGSGQLVILSGPSGVGKSTVLHGVLKRLGEGIRVSVSATTRAPRPGETDGIDYHFLTLEEFTRRHTAGDFLESMEVFGRGHWYGTLIGEVSPSLQSGKWVVLEIDVDGAQQALRHYPEAITIFIHPGDEAELERRLRGRGTEKEDAIQRRLEVARREIERSKSYRYQVVNQDVDTAVGEICDILESRGLQVT